MHRLQRIGVKQFERNARHTENIYLPEKFPEIHPAFVIGVVAMIVLAIVWSPWWLLPLGVYLLAIFISALVSTKSAVIACKAVPASVIQLGGYGLGFIRAYFWKIICRRGRNEAEEIAVRKGSNEKL